ncbi:MAG: ATP-binding protein [Saccharolobus sp.]|uniref:ATP-binding protein n=1 Tax=Saccharolobus TaxID=2100760 RepID=UPI001F109205|nr:ATP-binding protein [Saccharolobus shibatae]MCH4816188.1 ATP-binding protein [Saccharolobus shibatae]
MSSEERDLENVIDELRKKLDDAENEASKYGTIIGRVTRYETVTVNENELVGVDILFDNYQNSDIKRGQYLAIRSIIKPIIMLGQVYSISRADALARLGIRELTYPRDPSTIVTTTYIALRPIAEMEGDKIRPAVSPIDPQSPVFIPNPNLIERILRIPENGIVIGKIFSGGEEIEAEVRLDQYALRHHTLILGTTGSGKTTLLKTIISSQDIDKSTLIFDRQGDFVNFLKGRKDFSVLMPVVEEPNSKVSIQDHVEDFANWYGCDPNTINVVNGYGAFVKCNNHDVFVVPYSINFYDNLRNFNKITPYFTARASMYWEAIIDELLDKIRYSLKDKINRVLTDYEIASMLRDNLTPGKLIGNISVTLSGISISSNFSKDEVAYDPKTKTLTFHMGKMLRSVMKELELAYSTQDVIVRTLKAYESYGIFTVPGTVDFRPDKIPNDDVVVDLSWVMEKSASIEAVATIAYKVLEDFFAWKDELYKKQQDAKLSLIIMDEAHEYFPQTDSENVSKDIVEGLINKVMRLGRVRNMGVVLATHVPEDLNPLVLQLANTKVVMRNESHVLRRIGLEEYEDFLKHAIPGLGIVYSINFSEIPIKTLLTS